MRGVARGKQNNLPISAFRDSLVNWAVLQDQIQDFVFAEAGNATKG